MADPLIWLVVPGAREGTGAVYEDDGDTVAYRYGEGVLTWLDYSLTAGEAAGAPGSAWRATVAGKNGTASFAGFDGMPSARAQYVSLKGVRALPETASCNGAPLRAAAPGDAPGFWLEPDADPGVRPGAQKSLVLACGPLSFAGASAATHVIEASWANATTSATGMDNSDNDSGSDNGSPSTISLRLDTVSGPIFPGETPSQFWTAAPMTDQNLDSNRTNGWLLSTADLAQSGDLALLGWAPPGNAPRTYPLTARRTFL